MSDTMNLQGPVLQLLAFFVVLRFPTFNGEMPELSWTFAILKSG